MCSLDLFSFDRTVDTDLLGAVACVEFDLLIADRTIIHEDVVEP